MKRNWKYLLNQFDNITRNNYKKALRISIFHDAVLKTKKETEPLLIPIYERYHPLHVALAKEYSTWKSAGGSQEGQTLNVEQLLDLSYTKLKRWNTSIQAMDESFMNGTPNYIAIFNNGRSSFSKGSIESRINAYDALAKNLVPFVMLSGIRTEIAATFVILEEARKLQLGTKGTLKSVSGKVEEVRVAAMKMQWRNLGFAMDAFCDQEKYIESLFDLDTLRESRQRKFTGTLAPEEQKRVLVHTFFEDDVLRLKNNGTAVVKFYLASSENGSNSNAITVTAKSEEEIVISEFGVLDFSKHRFLTAINQSDAVVTRYEVSIR